MKRPTGGRVRAWATQLLMHMAMRLLGARHAAWAEAMQAEVASVACEREALAFAWGCLCAALRQAFVAALGGWAQVQAVGVSACVLTVLAGCVFMFAAGAPGRYVGMNLLSLALALATFCVLPRRRLQADALLRARVAFALGALLLAAALGQASTGASVWLRLGPVPLNLAWLLLPALLVAADLRPGAARPWALGGVLMACGALALFGDPVSTAWVAAVLGVRAWHARSGSLALLALGSAGLAMHLGQAWQAPQALAFVDQLVQRGFDHHLGTGLALALLQVLPLWPALRHRQARVHGLVWGLLVALSLPGWMPSPLLGCGGSFIVAYLLSLALLGDEPAEAPATRPRPAAPRADRAPPTWRRSRPT